MYSLIHFTTQYIQTSNPEDSAAALAALPLVCGFQLVWILFVCSIWIGIIALFVFWIKMLIDAIKRDYEDPNDKVIWIIVVALTNWIGALIYYFMVKNKDKS